MRPIGLIAINFLREQRWAALLLLIWVVISAVLAYAGQVERGDVLFFVKQQAVYGVAFSAFLAGSSIHNERRSRRILAVLSKGIERRQYVAGLLCGVLLVAAIYVVAMGILGSLIFLAAGIPVLHLWQMLALLMVACMVAASTALLFATFAPPIVAVALTALALGVGAGAMYAGATANFLPVYVLLDTVTSYGFPSRWEPHWTPAVWGVLQAVVLWWLAAWIFERRDIAVALE